MWCNETAGMLNIVDKAIDYFFADFPDRFSDQRLNLRKIEIPQLPFDFLFSVG